MRECTESEFLKDVATHKMTILYADGLYRHLKFRASINCWNQWFEIITWPNALTLAGDMGTWTFSRVEDMFTFFRGSADGPLKINEGYWAEKLQGGDCYGSRAGAMQFDADYFRELLFRQPRECHSLEADQIEFIERELKNDFRRCEDNEHEAVRIAYEFHCEVPGYGRFEFSGSDLPDGRVYTYRFIWCLYAIVWGIRQWDVATKPPEEQSA